MKSYSVRGAIVNECCICCCLQRSGENEGHFGTRLRRVDSALWSGSRNLYFTHSMATQSAKLARQPSDKNQEPQKEPEEVIRFSPEEEAVIL